MDKPTIQAYINNFRRHLASFLRPGIGLKCLVHPAATGGAILEFNVGTGIENDDTYLPEVLTLGKALAGIPQRAFGGNLDGMLFGGTNVILEPGKIILIKDGSPTEWTDSAAQNDVKKIVLPRGADVPRGGGQ